MTRAGRASASSPSCSPPTTGCWPRRARSTSATSSCTRSGCCARSRTCARAWPRATRHVLVDELQDASFAQGLLLRLLVAEHGGISAFADDDQAIHRFRGAATKNIRDFRAEWPLATVVRLDESLRSRRAAAGGRGRGGGADRGPAGQDAGRGGGRAGRRGRVLALRVRARAGAGRRGGGRAAAVARARWRPRTCACWCAPCARRARRSRSRSRSARCRTTCRGAAAFFQRAEVRDLLAWLRLLVDPGDAGAVVRALARPPVELRAIDLARVTQIARRRKLDMVAALSAPRWSRRRSRPRRASGSSRSSSSTAARPRALDSSRPGPLRAPAGRAARAAAAAAVRGHHRGRRAAAQPRPLRGAGGRVRAARAAGHRARVRPLDRRRRRRRACARRRPPTASARAACA